VRTGRGRALRNADITPRVLLASACLPTLFQAVEIDGEAYRDGGYSGNPTITPHGAREILNRLNEVSFNAVLLKELRMIALLRQIADPGDTEGARRPGMRVQYASMDLDILLGEV
jgi:NTE family protein